MVSQPHLYLLRMSVDLITDKEIEIIHSLTQRVLYYKDLITTCSDLCGELDRLSTLLPCEKDFN